MNTKPKPGDPGTEIPRNPWASGAKCHRCGTAWDFDALRAGVEAKTIAAQEWTGRAFCRPGCWDAYLESEGLK